MEKIKTVCDCVSNTTKFVVKNTIELYKKVAGYIKSFYSTMNKNENIDIGLSHVEITVNKNMATEKILEQLKEESKAENKEVRRAAFKYHNSQAKEVNLSADFLGWKTIPMERRKDGTWRVAVELTPGKYTYKFVVDGQWIKDPQNSVSSADGYGGESSVLALI